MESLGFVVGGSVRVISELNGDLIVNIKESRVAISRGWPTASWFDRPGEKQEGRVSEMSRTLKQVKCGETVTVRRLQGEGPVKRRIMDMGITKGTPVYVRKVAPLGDPVEVTVRGYELSLRKGDADMVLVE